ncbi:MAG: hypothetical protein JW810_06205 [Sedimentisphaerales bacterium]|nr:hypothetical protein [Sedimentisphaerales bacterium]
MPGWFERKWKDLMERRKHEVVFYTYPKFIFCWPLIVMGYALWFLDRWQVVHPEILAWIWGITLLIVLVTVGFDLNRNMTIFWVVLLVAFWLLVVWLRDAKSITIFSRIYRLFADLDPVYSRSLALMISITLSLLALIMWAWTRINSKWRITHNEFEHYQFGKMDDSLARGAKRVRVSYPDFFELLLCLAGDLIIYDSVGRRELRCIPHVPMLPYVKRRINRLLETTAVSASEMDDEAESAAETDDDNHGI